MVYFLPHGQGRSAPEACCKKIHAFYPNKPEYSGIFELQPRANDKDGFGDAIYRKIANAYTNSSRPSVVKAKADAGLLIIFRTYGF